MDVNDKHTEEQEPSIDIGARLCEARDNLGLDSEKIAKELNLAVEIITKIEQNTFHQDIPVAFIRGYVKAYSTKVGLDTPKILAEFDTQTSGDAPSLSRVQSISKFDSSRRELNSNSFIIKAVSLIVVLLFLSYGGYEIWKRFASDTEANTGSDEIELALQDADGSNDTDLESATSQTLTQSETDNSITEDEKSQATKNNLSANLLAEEHSAVIQSQSVQQRSRVEQNAGSTSQANSPENVQPTSETAQSQTGQGQTGQSQNLPEGRMSEQPLDMTPLVFDFSADCWVRIVDARGEVIALGVKRAGKHMPVEGVKPFNVVLGDPSVVTLRYNNQNYDLSNYRAGRRAEIILN